LLVPVVQMLRLPATLSRPGETSGPAWDRYVKRYGKRLVRNPRVIAGHPEQARLVAALEASGPGASGQLEAEIDTALRFLDREANAVTARYAAAVFTTTAVSQSGRLDTILVLSAQFRMVKEIAGIYSQRPRPGELWRLYGNVGAAAFVAGELQDSELLAVLGAPVTAGIAGFLPVAGTNPLLLLLVSSLLDGSANAFLTLRIGVLARRYSGLRVEANRRLLGRSASLEAAGLVGGVVQQGARRIVGLTKQLTKDQARSLFGKGFAGRTTAGGVKFLEESLRFWETVAAEAPAGDEGPPAGPR
jgi:hypothetical protein